MSVTVIVLARSYTEGGRLLSRLGIRGTTIATPGRLTGLRPTVILETPGFAHRADRHAIESALRWSQPAPIRMLVDPEDWKPEPAPAPDELPGQTTVNEQVALAEADRMRRLSAFEVAPTAIPASPEQAEADAPAPMAELPPAPRPRAKQRPKRAG